VLAEIAALGELLDETEALPRLRRLESEYRFRPSDAPMPREVVDALLDTRVGRRLEELAWSSGADSIAAWVAALEATRFPSLRMVRLDAGWGLQLRLTRGGDRRFSVLAALYADRPRGDVFATLRSALETMPEGTLSRL
jgi:hypothetical protein